MGGALLRRSCQTCRQAQLPCLLLPPRFFPLQQPTTWNLGGVVTQSNTYSPTSFRPQTSSALNSAGVALQTLNFSFDQVGHLASWSDALNAVSLNYGYDPLNRLKSVTGGYPQTYAYDAIGNLTQLTRPQDSLGFTFPAPGQPRPHAPITSTKGLTYTYDANGNLSQIENAQSQIVNQYAYDAENRLAQVISGAQTTIFGYDGNGERVIRRANNGEITQL